MVEQDVRQEEQAQDTADVAQELEGVLLIYLVGKIAKALESKEAKPEDLKEIRDEISKQVGVYLPLMIKSSNSVLKREYENVKDSLKGKVPKYSDDLSKETEKYWEKYIKTDGKRFIVGDSGQKIPQYFNNACDKYIKQIVDGSTTVQQAVEDIVNDLAKNGIKAMDYDSGVTRRLDVLAKQQVLYAERQSTQGLIEKWAKENNHTIFEFSAHMNARPTHQLWQGKRFDTTGKYYPTLWELTHGQNKDYGCRHYFKAKNKDDPYDYTQEELDNLNTKPFEFKGKTYEGFEASQLMARYERDIKNIKTEIALNKSQNIDVNNLEVKRKKKMKEYKEICEKMEMSPRYNRMKVIYY